MNNRGFCSEFMGGQRNTNCNINNRHCMFVNQVQFTKCFFDLLKCILLFTNLCSLLRHEGEEMPKSVRLQNFRFSLTLGFI